MVVPFPDDASVDLTAPTPDEVAWLMRGFVGAVDDGTGLTALQFVMLDAVALAMTGVRIESRSVVGVRPEAFAAGLAHRNRAFRERIVQIMLLAALIRRPPAPAAMESIGACATELGLDGTIVNITAGYAAGAFDAAVVDFERNGYLGDTAQHAMPSGPWSSVEDDGELAQRWRSLGELPAQTVGRRVFDFYQSRGFRFPGSPGSAPPLLTQHDWVHVLADYGTTVENELEVFAFIARANDDPRAFSLLAMVVSLFETGVVGSAMGLFQSDPGHLGREGMAQRVADAMRRGAVMPGSHDFLALDWFAVADRPLDVLRRELGLPPKSPEALGAGSVGPWQPGGISAFQSNAGRSLALEENRPYLDYGAVVG